MGLLFGLALILSFIVGVGLVIDWTFAPLNQKENTSVTCSISSVSPPDEGHFEESEEETGNADFRPTSFDEYVGQQSVKEALTDFIEASKVREEVFSHFLISGQAGTGKTLLAQIIANQLDVKFVETIASAIESPEILLNKIAETDGGVLFIDECLPKGSLIVSSDGGVYPIENFTEGSLFMGGKIKSFLKRKTKKLLKIKTSRGEIITTPTHPHLTYKLKYPNWYKEKNIIEKRAKKLKVGDYLISPKYIPHTTKYQWTKDQLAFVALTIADGCFMINKYKNQRYNSGLQYSFKNKKHFLKAKQIIEKCKNSFDVKNISITYTKNRDYVIRIYGTEFAKFISKTFDITVGKNKKYNTTINNQIFYSSLESIKTFIDTIWFFEGWEARNKYIQMVSKCFIKRFILLNKKIGNIVNYSEVNTPTMKKKKNSKAFRATLSSMKRNQKIYKGEEIIFSKIKSIEEINTEETVYDYTTSTGIFVVDNFITHNCHALPREVAEACLYRTMEEFKDHTGRRVKRFTLAGCTTELGEILETRKPLYERFKLPIELEPYEKEDLVKIAKQYKEKQYPDDVLPHERLVYNKIGSNARGTPRKAIKYVDAIIRLNGDIDKAFKFFKIIKKGFTKKDLEVLKYLSQTDKPIGLKGLVAYLGTSQANFEYSVEPYLVQTMAVQRTPRGRIITEKGREYVKELEEELKRRGEK